MSGKTPKKKERPGVDRMGRTDLHYAASDGDAEKILKLVASGDQVDLADDNGWTPLHFAAQASSPAVAKILLDAGAPVDPQDSHGNTPLFRAVYCSRGDGELIKLLRARGADPFKVNYHGNSPYSLANKIASSPVAQFFSDLQPPNAAPD